MSEEQINPIPPSHDDTPRENEATAKAHSHTRRAFLFKLSVALNAAVGAVLAVPLIGYLIAPALKKPSATGAWIALGNLSEFPVGETRLAEFVSPVASLTDGETAKTACWVRRVSEEKLQVFAINCAHLGCPVRWFAQSKLFLCPCHGGAYYEDGRRASGPPERGLFEYRYQIASGSLLIHAGDMPTLSTEARCKPQQTLTQIAGVGSNPASATDSTIARSDEWQA